MAATKRQPQTKVTYLRFAALDEVISHYTLTTQQSLLWWPVNIGRSFALRQQKPQYGDFWNKTTLPQDLQFLVDRSLVEVVTLRTKKWKCYLIMRKYEMDAFRTINATHLTVVLKDGSRPIHQQPYRGGQKS